MRSLFAEQSCGYRELDTALTMLRVLCLVGLGLCGFVALTDLSRMHPYGTGFFVLYLRNEPVSLALLLVALFLLRPFLLRAKYHAPLLASAKLSTNFVWLWLPVIAVVLVAWAGNYLVLHDFPLSNDEFLPRFQARIFCAGKLFAELPTALRAFTKAFTPIFATYDPAHGTWTSSYLPVHAALQALFLALGQESLTSPVLAGLSLVSIAVVARRLWPREPLAPWLAILLLATSSQFLITSMTSYAYPAHLCFNLVWLSFYCRNDRLGMCVTPWIGFLALGLHNPVVHALFVVPFLWSMARRKPWGVTLYFGSVYAAGCLTWYLWWTKLVVLSNTELHPFLFRPLYQCLIQPINLSMFVSWQSIALLLLTIISLLHWKSLTPMLKLLATGVLMTFLFYMLYPMDQVLGWGYRFLYGVLGNLALVAVAGWFRLRDALGFPKAWSFIVASTVVAICVQFPLRCWQVEGFIAPFAKASQALEVQPQDVLILDASTVWFSQLLVRNDPFLKNGPKRAFSQFLSKDDLEKLRALGSVHHVTPEELARFGLHAFDKQH